VLPFSDASLNGRNGEDMKRENDSRREMMKHPASVNGGVS